MFSIIAVKKKQLHITLHRNLLMIHFYLKKIIATFTYKVIFWGIYWFLTRKFRVKITNVIITKLYYELEFQVNASVVLKLM